MNSPCSFVASKCACKTFNLISDVLQKPSSAGSGNEVLGALFRVTNYWQRAINNNHYIIVHVHKYQGPVVQMLISANPGLNIFKAHGFVPNLSDRLIFWSVNLLLTSFFLGKSKQYFIRTVIFSLEQMLP